MDKRFMFRIIKSHCIIAKLIVTIWNDCPKTEQDQPRWEILCQSVGTVCGRVFTKITSSFLINLLLNLLVFCFADDKHIETVLSSSVLLIESPAVMKNVALALFALLAQWLLSVLCHQSYLLCSKDTDFWWGPTYQTYSNILVRV